MWYPSTCSKRSNLQTAAVSFTPQLMLISTCWVFYYDVQAHKQGGALDDILLNIPSRTSKFIFIFWDLFLVLLSLMAVLILRVIISKIWIF